MFSSFILMTAMILGAAPEAGQNAGQDAFPPMFPFIISAENLPSALTRDGKLTEITDKDSVNVSGSHFVDANGKTIRLLGTNFSFAANFPNKADAESEAKRLARLGVNCVRLHHMDSRNIWGKNISKGVTEIDPDELDKLDYLIYQLKKNGVYVNINLHVSRKFTDKEGFTGYGERPDYDKGLDNFEPRMIAFQKQYAKDLLTHKNPYTGMTYTEDPCVASIEINNENSVVASWFWGNLDRLPAVYEAELQKQWNAWLAKKYANTDAMRETWNCRVVPLSDEMISGYSQPNTRPWYFQMDGNARASITYVTENDKSFVRMTVESNGNQPWIPQWIHSQLAFKSKTPYTLSFRARANDKKTMSVNVGMDHDPWQNLGLYAQVHLTPEWQTFTYSFMPSQDDDQGRISFGSLLPGTYEIADVSLKSGGAMGSDPSEKLEDSSVRILKRRAATHMTPEGMRDFTAFLIATEDAYWYGMYDYIKNTLKAKAPVAGTQLQYGAHYPQARLDFCDIHAYWHHPHFPGGGWSGYHWLLHNRAMVNHLGHDAMTNLASLRVIGKPYTVSEYNHPYPNLYAAEGLPMLATLAGFQDWSGIYLYSWSHDANYPRDMAKSFFDACGNAVQLAHMIACHNLFVRGDMQDAALGAANDTRIYDLSKERELDIYAAGRDDYHRSLQPLGIENLEALKKYTGVNLTDTDLLKQDKNLASNAPKSKTAAKNSLLNLPLRFNKTEDGTPVSENGWFVANTANTMLFTGFIPEKPVRTRLGTLTLDENRLNWATVSVTRMSNSGGPSPRYLIAATGLMKNTDIRIRPYKNPDQETDADRTDTADVRSLYGQPITVSNQWGHAPVLCEGISGEFRFNNTRQPRIDRIKCYVLDGAGNRVKEIPVTDFTIQLSPEHKTLWYEVECRLAK